MRPETAQFFENARDMLVRGRRMLEVDLYEDAGRAAYLAAFHAAQAFIFEREYRTLKITNPSRPSCAASCPAPMRSRRSLTTIPTRACRRLQMMRDPPSKLRPGSSMKSRG